MKVIGINLTFLNYLSLNNCLSSILRVFDKGSNDLCLNFYVIMLTDISIWLFVIFFIGL